MSYMQKEEKGQIQQLLHGLQKGIQSWLEESQYKACQKVWEELQVEQGDQKEDKWLLQEILHSEQGKAG